MIFSEFTRKQNMFKGRLLRQEAINLESDQKTGKITDANETGYVGLNTGSLPETDSNKTTVKLSPRLIPTSILEASASQNRSKLQKREIFSKRIHSSPSNISKSEFVNVTRRANSADDIGFELENSCAKGQPIAFTRDTRTLEEVVHDFFLYFYNKGSGEIVQVEKCYSEIGSHLNERQLYVKTGDVKFKDSLDVTKPLIDTKRQVTVFEGEKYPFFLC